MPESLYGAHPKKLPVRFKLPSHLDLLRFQHAKVKVGSPDHIQESDISMLEITGTGDVQSKIFHKLFIAKYIK